VFTVIACDAPYPASSARDGPSPMAQPARVTSDLNGAQPQNRPHYADPIGCPVLAVGAQAYVGDAVARQLAQVARDVRGVVIPAAGHNIACENPAALAEAYLEFFAAG
jgi:pimeloyl-ACP methyl ester carboxylesterase